MDFVLSVSDNLFFDRIYAAVLPIAGSGPSLETLKANATALAGAVAAARVNSPIENDMISEYLGLKPTEYAYLSQWQRSDWQRQTTSLMLVTWYNGLLITSTMYNHPLILV